MVQAYSYPVTQDVVHIECMHGYAMEQACTATHGDVASFTGPSATFGCTKECRGPGMFPHVCDVEGRKVVERT